MPSRSHPGVLRPRAGGGVEVEVAEVHDILSAACRADEVNGHLRAMTQNAEQHNLQKQVMLGEMMTRQRMTNHIP